MICILLVMVNNFCHKYLIINNIIKIDRIIVLWVITISFRINKVKNNLIKKDIIVNLIIKNRNLKIVDLFRMYFLGRKTRIKVMFNNIINMNNNIKGRLWIDIKVNKI